MKISCYFCIETPEFHRAMLSPGAKGWINKYFDLVDKMQIDLAISRPEGMRKLNFMHLTLGHSGLVFGYPMQLIFARNLDDSRWTTEEKLKLLLFEAHLFVYLQINRDKEFSKKDFTEQLFSFYKLHNSSTIKKLFSFKSKDQDEMLENALTKRIDIKRNLLDNKWWVNSLSNAFAYLDVLLFDDFVHKEKHEALLSYDLFAQNALTAITLAAYSDGEIEKKEKDMFDLFLASARLDDHDRELVKERFKRGAKLEDFSSFVKDHWLFKRFLLDLSILTIFSTQETLAEEIEYLEELSIFLNIPEVELNDSLRIAENFILKSKNDVVYLSDDSNYEKVYSRFKNSWSKILIRNEDKLAIELKESKELVVLIKTQNNRTRIFVVRGQFIF